MIYADSSFLVSSYIDDVHSTKADLCMAQSPSVWITPLNRTELAHAFSQYVFRGKLSPFEAQQAWNLFQQDCSRGVWIPVALPENIWGTSITLARIYGPTLGVRTLDSLPRCLRIGIKG